MAAKQMPQNTEAEMSVLGVCFLNKYALEKVMDELDTSMFYNEANKKIFEALTELYKTATPVDITTVKNELDKQKNLGAIGGIEYISEVIDSVATTANLESYIKIVKEKAIRRKLIDTATNIITDTYEEERPLESLLDNSERKILDVAKARTVSELTPIQDALRNAQEKLELLAKSGSEITGLPTGFYDLDRATTGMHPEELIIIGARPAMGKTAFALNIAVNAAMKTDKAVAIFNLEMSSEMLVNRMISAVGSIEGDKLKTGRLDSKDWKKYNEALSQLAATNIYIEDDVSVTMPEIKAKCRRLANDEKGLGLVVIDYLQLLNMGGKSESRQIEVSEISRSLKKMAVELQVPVVALAQLTRGAEQRKDTTQPRLVDLRESGSIEQDADIVLFINRQDYHEDKTDLNKQKIVPTDIIIAKHRQGSTGAIQLLFELDKGCFKNYQKVDIEEPV